MKSAPGGGRVRHWPAIVLLCAVFGLLLFAGRSCGSARHEVPSAAEGETVWIATFNGL
jgi:hypothetical protein